MPIRVIHTADVHLDACFASPGMAPGFGNRRRQSLRDVLHAILARATEWPADAVLIAGDLFEHERVTRDTVAYLRAEFEAVAPIPVFIAPGNHDPFVLDSPYGTEPWPNNVFIFRTPSWTAHALDGCALTVHGFAFDGPDVSSNPFGLLSVPRDGRVHVAVAHGSERSHQPPNKGAYAPFDAAAAAADGLAYLALGHFHALTQIQGSPATAIYYSGAPEGHDFGETGPHHYIEVELDQDGVRVTPVVSSRSVYAVHTLDCSALTTAQQVAASVRAFKPDDSAGQILRVILTGVCVPEVRDSIAALREALAPEFQFLEFADETAPADDYNALAAEPTSLGAFVAAINEEIADAPDESQRRLLVRAREVGLAALRGRALAIRGSEGASP